MYILLMLINIFFTCDKFYFGQIDKLNEAIIGSHSQIHKKQLYTAKRSMWAMGIFLNYK